MGQQTIRPITLEIDEDLWTEFKETVPRSKTLNQALVELIERAVNS